MAIAAFSNFSISVADGGTAPSLDYLSDKTYVNIGSGNILKVLWNTPIATNNAVAYYKVYILAYDPATINYYLLHSINVGDVNEFYLKADLFSDLPQAFIPIRIYVKVISKYGTAYSCTSNIETVNICRGSGTYLKVDAGYAKPIMKRSLAFANLDFLQVLSLDGSALADADGNALFSKQASVQDPATGWSLMQEFLLKDCKELALLDSNNPELLDINEVPLCTKSSEVIWLPSNIKYEILTDSNGEVITDIYGEDIFVL